VTGLGGADRNSEAFSEYNVRGSPIEAMVADTARLDEASRPGWLMTIHCRYVPTLKVWTTRRTLAATRAPSGRVACRDGKPNG
jgi:hypothetical protein